MSIMSSVSIMSSSNVVCSRMSSMSIMSSVSIESSVYNVQVILPLATWTPGLSARDDRCSSSSSSRRDPILTHLTASELVRTSSGFKWPHQKPRRNSEKDSEGSCENFSHKLSVLIERSLLAAAFARLGLTAN
ncbi:hypothetical protein RRG08_038408 [Elysia crispata]|uniref:Uncharacterized protein n=1 Tax=Elysia crispata TaxID=231223 RepID=A0AAE1B903_9GAST|nr:hypothetical protein RRG08_038408 [Elysia crispata]